MYKVDKDRIVENAGVFLDELKEALRTDLRKRVKEGV